MPSVLPSTPFLAALDRRSTLLESPPAVISGSRSLSAAEVDSAATDLARRLVATGIGKGDYVGIGLDRCPELIIAILAVVKAGAAYVPLDPAYPFERLRHMISSASIRLVLTRATFQSVFSAAGAPAILDVGSFEKAPAADLPEEDPDAPLYAIFTSGSTGAPKAASVYRRSFANLISWYADEFQLGPADRTLVISSPSFDLTQKNFFTPLLSGGTLVLDQETTYDISRITGLIRSHGITLINCTPSAFYPLVDAAAAGGYADLATLRFAILGGEPISIPRLRAWLEHPSCRAEIGNTYGPTECTDICAFHRMHRGNLDDFPFVPLGREIPNVRVSIRDVDSLVLPDGEVGELCISGAGLGGGYLGDPTRTAERFVQHHTLYRTGDLAKRLPDGTLEFRGRADHQVKVNGFRIELGEIEIVLSRHPAVREAVVLASGGLLTAHVQGSQITIPELRAHLEQSLPGYMIPNAFRFVENFPLTPNGKVDRLALAREEEAPPAEALATPAETADATESRILALWSDVLGRSVHDPEANFFDLGGTSILVAVVHVRLREIAGRDLPITELFARPSARSLAEFITPRNSPTAAPTARDRARLQQASMSRFRRPGTPR
ncbi:MAG: amino acid adenylation protein [Akkermansiaceae bacterium]|nr:amino acid adenylation protein [Akkermansiaceae bacterium]